jgi:hypothetical protein
MGESFNQGRQSTKDAIPIKQSKTGGQKIQDCILFIDLVHPRQTRQNNDLAFAMIAGNFNSRNAFLYDKDEENSGDAESIVSDEG